MRKSLFCRANAPAHLVSLALLAWAHSGFAQITLQHTSGSPNDPIVIQGSGFGDKDHPGTVKIQHKAVPIVSWSDNEIRVAAPDRKAEGSIHLLIEVFDSSGAPKGFAHFQEISALVPPASSPGRLSPGSGPGGTTMRIDVPGHNKTNPATIKIENEVVPGNWGEGFVTVPAPNRRSDDVVELEVEVVDATGATISTDFFTETPSKAAAIEVQPAAGLTGQTISIHGEVDFPEKQGSRTVLFDGSPVISSIDWKKDGIRFAAPDFTVSSDTPVAITIQDADGKLAYGPANFIEKPGTIAQIYPDSAVTGEEVKIVGRGFPTAAEKTQVLIGGIQATIKSASANEITITTPHLDIDSNIISPLPVEVINVDTNQIVARTINGFTVPSKWGDADADPLEIRFVGGAETGFQSGQSSSNTGFLAVYGRKLFGDDTRWLHSVGPFFGVRLLTAPQSSDTFNVVSVLQDPTGQITTDKLKTVGSAADLTLGLESNLFWFSNKRISIGLVGGAGFVTPLEGGSVTATFKMPDFGTVECTQLQGRLSTILSGPQYTNIKANTDAASTACFSNKAAATPTDITLLQYAASDSPNFYPKYGVGLRLINRWNTNAAAPEQCTQNNPCERGYVDFTVGQNASITGGKLRHGVFSVDTTYPMPVQTLNWIYLFGSGSMRFHKLPPKFDPLILAPGNATDASVAAPSTLVVPLNQPDRDFYRIGAGVDVKRIFCSMTGACK